MAPRTLDLLRRRPVWEALSEFFLDTELDEARLREIAGILLVSGYSVAELDDILTQELAPLLYINGLAVAGTWEGFNVDWIEREILAGRHLAIRRWYNLPARLICRWFAREAKDQYWFRTLAYFKTPEALQICRGPTCAKCAYDLTGNTAGVCPECGTACPTQNP